MPKSKFINTENIENIESFEINEKESDNNSKVNIFTPIDINNIFINLRLITKLEIGNKIYINNNFINIDNSYIKSISRWYNDFNRYDNLNFVKKVIENSFLLNDELIKNKDLVLLKRLNNELKLIIYGLINYKQTYINDKLFHSEIDVLNENIKNKIEQNNLLL